MSDLPRAEDWPLDDDWERISCTDAGKPLHFSCGWCATCSQPVFRCGHFVAAVS